MRKIHTIIAVSLIPLVLLSACGRLALQESYDATQTASSALSATQTLFNPNLPLAATITPAAPTEPHLSPTPEIQLPVEPTAPVATPTDLPSPTPDVIQNLPEPWSRIQQRMQSYGQVQEDYLSPDYRQSLSQAIAGQGEAGQILSLELHGDNYSMFEERYSLTPEIFYSQVETLLTEGYHFATIHEVEGFVYGWFPLPAKTIILTTDISSQTVNSLYSIAQTFAALEQQFGVRPHMIVYPWTGDMLERPGIACDGDSCWQALRDARDSGYFTFGSHSQTHPDFSTVGFEQLETDWLTSRQAMLNNLGLNVYSLAWPFEVCSQDTQAMLNMGFTIGWGGVTKSIAQNYTTWQDPAPLCLPRMFPPAISGLSMRPEGLTWQQMLEAVAQ
jgi:Polysaccharide deacetylase.